jgi:predicted dehydrogenase
MACDNQQSRVDELKKMHPEVEVTTDFRHMFNGADIHAVVITTPPETHYPLAIESLIAGRHTLIEKPMTTVGKDAEELIRVAKEKKLVLMVGHTFLYSPVFRQVQEIIRRGDIGTISHIAASRLNLGIFQRNANVSWDLAPHDISMIVSLMGDLPVAINCIGNAHLTRGIEDIATIHLKFKGGRTATITVSWRNSKKVREINIIGTKGAVIYDDAALEKIRVSTAHVERKVCRRAGVSEFVYKNHRGQVTAPDFDQGEPLREECQHFLDCIKESKTPLSDGNKGLEGVRILEAAHESLKRGGAPIRLLWPENCSTPRTTRNRSRVRLPHAIV